MVKILIKKPFVTSWIVFLVSLLIWGLLATSFDINNYDYQIDEGAHYITSLLVYDFLRECLFCNPVDFATEQYIHYPFNRIGLNSPFFYSLSGVWSLIFGSSKLAHLSIIGFFSALICLGLFLLYKKKLPIAISCFLAISAVLLPFSLQSSLSFMLDIPITMFCLWAILTWHTYMTKPSLQRSVLFGILAGFAILIKGNALFLALLVPVSLLMTRRTNYVFRRDIWASLFIVILIAGPWTYLSLDNTMDGFRRDIAPTARLWSYGINLIAITGPLFPLLSIIGLIERSYMVILGKLDEQSTIFWGSIVSSVFAVIIFQAFMPVTELIRYLLPALLFAPLLVFSALSLIFSIPPLKPYRNNLTTLSLLGVLVLTTIHGIPSIIERNTSFRDAAKFVAAMQYSHTPVILTSSNSHGATAFGAALAEHDPSRRNYYVVRGSRIFDKGQGFLDSEFKSNLTSVEQAVAEIQKIGVTHIIMDYSEAANSMSYNNILREMIDSQAECCTKIWEAVKHNANDQPLIIYEIKQTIPAPSKEYLHNTQKPKRVIL